MQRKEEKKERSKPQNFSDAKTTKELLGRLFEDKEYLEKLCDAMTTSENTFIKERAYDGLEYLSTRADFWRQQNPMYARKRDKERQRQKLQRTNTASGLDPMEYIIKKLEEIDNAQAEGKHDVCLSKSKKTLDKVEKWTDDQVTNRPQVIANLHSCMGNACLELDQLEEALRHHQQDLDIGREHDIEEAKSRAMDNLGRTYARMGRYDKAVEIWEEKVPLSKSVIEGTWLYHEIGRCYLEMNQFADARDYGEKSLAAAQECDDESWQLHATVLIAQAEVKLGELQAAAETFERAHGLAQAQDDQPAMAAIKKALEDVNKQIVQGADADDHSTSETGIQRADTNVEPEEEETGNQRASPEDEKEKDEDQKKEGKETDQAKDSDRS